MQSCRRANCQAGRCAIVGLVLGAAAGPLDFLDRTEQKSFTEQYLTADDRPYGETKGNADNRTSQRRRTIQRKRPCDTTGARWIDGLREAGYRSGSTPRSEMRK